MINNLTMSKLVAVKGDMVIGSFAVFSLVLGSVVTFTLTSFFSTILPVKRNLLTYLDQALVFSLQIGIMSQVSSPFSRMVQFSKFSVFSAGERC